MKSKVVEVKKFNIRNQTTSLGPDGDRLGVAVMVVVRVRDTVPVNADLEGASYCGETIDSDG